MNRGMNNIRFLFYIYDREFSILAWGFKISSLDYDHLIVFQDGSRTLFDISNRFEKSDMADGGDVCYDFGVSML